MPVLVPPFIESGARTSSAVTYLNRWKQRMRLSMRTKRPMPRMMMWTLRGRWKSSSDVILRWGSHGHSLTLRRAQREFQNKTVQNFLWALSSVGMLSVSYRQWSKQQVFKLHQRITIKGTISAAQLRWRQWSSAATHDEPLALWINFVCSQRTRDSSIHIFSIFENVPWMSTADKATVGKFTLKEGRLHYAPFRNPDSTQSAHTVFHTWFLKSANPFESIMILASLFVAWNGVSVNSDAVRTSVHVPFWFDLYNLMKWQCGIWRHKHRFPQSGGSFSLFQHVLSGFLAILLYFCCFGSVSPLSSSLFSRPSVGMQQSPF